LPDTSYLRRLEFRAGHFNKHDDGKLQAQSHQSAAVYKWSKHFKDVSQLFLQENSWKRIPKVGHMAEATLLYLHLL